ncbi:MAG: hypothetical protein ACTSWY_05980 [Promethearchaeota archaeon]
MTINLSKLAHIKVVVPNAEDAYHLLHNIFGAVKLKGDFKNTFVKVLYIGLGDFILQYIEPIEKRGPWYKHLQEKGPGIFSLAFIVENVKDVVEFLKVEEKIAPLLSNDGEHGEKIIEFPLEFLNPDVKTEYVMNTMEKIGFHLEFGEKPKNSDFIFPQTQYVTGSDKLIGDASTMLHFELVTADAEKTYEFLHRVFGSNKIELMFAALLDSDFMHILHVNLSNTVLQYCQPVGKERSWYELLKKNGSYVHNINFLVDDMEKTVEKYKNKGISYLFQQKLTPEDTTFYYMMDSIDILGFHMEHGQMPNLGDIPEGIFFLDLKKD